MIPPLPPSLARDFKITCPTLQIEPKGRASNAFFRVHFDDQAAGHYPVLDLDGCQDDNAPGKPARLALDPEQITALAQWCADVCKALDGGE